MKIFICLLVILFARKANAQMVIQSGAAVTTTGSAIVCLLNTDLQNNGTINQLSGTGKFVFNGNANSIISGTSMPNFAVLEIAKTGAAKLTLQQNIGINEKITFTAGTIELNNKNILLQPAALLIGESETSRITGITGGYIEITNTLNAPNAVNLGNLGAEITTAQNMGSTTIRRGHTSQTLSGGGAGSSIYRYFDILPSNNSGLNATLRIKYFDAELNAQTENSLVQYKSADNITWTDMGFTTRDANLNFVEKAGLADFSRWTLANANNIVPVTLINFSVACKNGYTVVLWKTAQEYNSGHFNVQMSNDGIAWETIGTVQAAGNSNTEKQYSYTNNKATSASGFYRLLQVDADGRFANSPIVKSNCNVLKIDDVNIFPNPVNDKVWVNINATVASVLQIKIVDEKGALVLMQNTGIISGNNVVPINMTFISKGSYHLQLVWNNGAVQKTVKLIKL